MPSTSLHTAFGKVQFEALFKSHFPYLRNYAQQYVGDMDTAQDICQRVFIGLWEKRANIDPAQSVKSYLFTSVKNRCLNYLRDNQKYRSRILDLDCGDLDLFSEEEPLALEELQNRINEALQDLPDKCRTVFEMSRYQGMKYKEIAEELGIAQKTVEAHMTKAMKSLRTQLKDYHLLILFLLGWLDP